MSYVTLKNQKRISVMMIITGILLVLLCVRLVFVQILDLNNFKEKAYEQQTRERSISAKRGNIYDSTGEKILAQSVSVNIITAVPNSIDKEDKEKVAENLAKILEKDKDDVVKEITAYHSLDYYNDRDLHDIADGTPREEEINDYIYEQNYGYDKDYDDLDIDI